MLRSVLIFSSMPMLYNCPSAVPLIGRSYWPLCGSGFFNYSGPRAKLSVEERTIVEKREIKKKEKGRLRLVILRGEVREQFDAKSHIVEMLSKGEGESDVIPQASCRARSHDHTQALHSCSILTPGILAGAVSCGNLLQ
jgi:hypothetical protein